MKDPQRITRIEVSEGNRKLRIVLIVVFLAIGIAALTAGFMGLLRQETGWQRVQVNPKERNCSSQFVLEYNFSGSGAQATAVNSKLQAAYSEVCVKAYRLFTPDEEIDGERNIWYINRHPNEEITVDPVLYNACSKLRDTRYLYLGPVYAHYGQIIYGSEESQLSQLDPVQDADSAALVSALAAFAADEAAVNLELRGENKVKLHVSDDYLSFLQQEELEPDFIDFAYMTNAFVIDYLADTLKAQELTDGYLVSADGFTRNLTADTRFSVNIFDRVDKDVYPAAVMEYTGPISMVFLKDYPTAESDRNYRAVEDRYVHLFADSADGIYRTAVHNLVSYSYELGCADVLLRMLPGFVGAEFALPQGVYSVWCDGQTVCYNDEAIAFTDLWQKDGRNYTTRLEK